MSLEHLFNTAYQSYQASDMSQAMHVCVQILDQDPGHIDTLILMGTILVHEQNYQDGLSFLNQALSLGSTHPQIYPTMAHALMKLSWHDEALDCYRKALVQQSDHAHLHGELGDLLHKMERFEEALEAYDQSLNINPSSAVYNNKANVLKDIKRFYEAIASCENAIEMDPNNRAAHRGKGLIDLLMGNFERGWQGYEWRNDISEDDLSYTQHLWRGQKNIKDQKLLILAEQGLGDYIQFARYLPVLEAMGMTVIAQVPSALESLMDTLPFKGFFVRKEDSLPDYDLHCPIMSLPLALGTTPDTIPTVPYLFVDASKKAQWAHKLGTSHVKRIGFVFSGSTGYGDDKNRSIPASMFEELLKLPFEFHCLQKEIREGDLSYITNSSIHVHTQDIEDFSDTAALIEHMDLVISVDTSIAHLAGAMGKPVWILLPYLPDFRWMLDRSDSPWYPTARLFRQEERGNWRAVFTEVQKKLPRLFNLNQY